jgi:hypothetical protein
VKMENDQDTLKDNHERFHLRVFSTLQPLPGDELPRQDHSQKPDFRFRCGELITGIEHTEIKKSRSARQVPSLAHLKGLHRQIVRKAERIATEQGLPPLNVQVLFHGHFYRYPNKGEETVNGLLRTVLRNLDKVMKMETGNSVEIEPPSPFVGISMVYVTPGTAYGKIWLSNHRWEVMEPGYVSIGFDSELQEAITKKNQKLHDYLKTCDQCWLLVVADRTKADQKFAFTPEMQEYVYESAFERTFFLEIAERFVTELTTTVKTPLSPLEILMSRSELPRVYQLIDLIGDRTHQDSYFQNFENSIEEGVEKRSFWVAREKELQKLDQEAWNYLKNEMFPYLTARNHRGRGWEQLISILNQTRAYNFLLHSGCSKIRFIPQIKGKETPDLEAKLDENSVICEVKTINKSAQEAEARQSGASRSTLASLELGFFNKLTSNLEKAKSQMSSYNNTPGVRHIAFVVVNFDDSLGEYKTDYYDEIDRHLAGMPVTEIEVVIFNQRTCFHNDVHMKNATVVNEGG